MVVLFFEMALQVLAGLVALLVLELLVVAAS
jgi:hypothetical protein